MLQHRGCGNRPPYLHDSSPVEATAEILGPILWQGRQWAVTSFGLEARDGRYPISARHLSELAPGELGLIANMSIKPWVDLPDFVAALAVARMFHAGRDRESAAIFKAFATKHDVPGFNRPKGRPGITSHQKGD
jgi:hypothetical protein